MNKFLLAGALAVSLGLNADAVVIVQGNQRIQVQNGVLLFNSPTVVNELPDVSVPSSVTSDSLQLSNGDFLYGKLLNIGPKHEVRWQHPDAQQPIEFKTTNITQIDLANARQLGDDTNNCKVDLINSDELRGSLVSCDKSNVVLNTVCAGQLRLSRAMLESLVLIPPVQPAVFSGPTGIEGWTHGKTIAGLAGDSGQWTYRNGAFYANKAASIARDVHLPDAAQIEFDLVWKSTLHMAIAVYTDSLQPVPLASKETGPDFGGFYSFQVNSSYMDMMPIKKKDPLKSLGAIAVPALMQRNRAHFDLRCSKRDHKLALLINGVLVKEWIDSDGFAGEGTGMRFVNQNMGSVKLTNLRIRPWDGQLEQPSPAQAHRVTDSVRLADGSRVVGNLESISNGKVAINTGSSNALINLSQLRQIDFATKDIGAAQTNSQPVKVLLTTGNVVSGQLQSWSPDAMTLKSPAFGTAKFDPKGVSRLQFSHD